MRAVRALLLLAASSGWAVDPATHAARALQYWQAGDRERALAAYGAALDLSGETAAYRHNRALIYLELKEWDRARDEAQRASDLAPKDGRLRVTLAAAWMDGPGADPKRARKLLKVGVRRLKFARDHLGLSRAHYNLGLLDRRAGDLKAARRHFAAALGEDGANEDARAALELLDSPSR